MRDQRHTWRDCEQILSWGFAYLLLQGSRRHDRAVVIPFPYAAVFFLGLGFGDGDLKRESYFSNVDFER